MRELNPVSWVAQGASPLHGQTRVHNQITQIDGSCEGILYDPAGNTLLIPPDAEGSWTAPLALTWDAWNRLVAVSHADDSPIAQYAYDGLFRRTLMLTPTELRSYYYNDQWKCVEERATVFPTSSSSEESVHTSSEDSESSEPSSHSSHSSRSSESSDSHSYSSTSSRSSSSSSSSEEPVSSSSSYESHSSESNEPSGESSSSEDAEVNGFQAFNAKMKEGRGFATIQSAANLDVLVVCQYVWGARPGHRDELVLRDRVTTPVTSQTSSEPPELDERLWSLMDYYDPTSAVNTDGEVVERYRFSAFGLRAVLDADFSPRTVSHYDWEFAFKGQFLDVDTGYYNYGYRYYSPELGRWLSRDPIGEEGGRYLYSMAENDPVNQIDYYGLFIDKLTRMYHCGKIIDKAKECADALANPDIVEACKEALSFVNDAGNLHEEFHQMVANHTESCWNEYTASGLSPYTGSLVVGGCAYDKAVDEFGEKYSSELAALDTCTCASACLALANSIRKCFSKNPAT